MAVMQARKFSWKGMPVVFLKMLYVVSIASWLVCGGCQQNSTGAHNDPDKNTSRSTVIAYYFHRTIRCVACITVESVAAQTIEDKFSEQLADGRLVWMRINLDESGGDQHERQFEVSGSTLVIATPDSGNDMHYKKLTKVWDLLSDPQALSEYVENEINEYLNR